MAEPYIQIINDSETFSDTLYELAGEQLGNEVMEKLGLWASTRHDSTERVLMILTNNPTFLNGVTPPFPFLVVSIMTRPADMSKSRTLFGLVLNLAEKCLVKSRVRDQYN